RNRLLIVLNPLYPSKHAFSDNRTRFFQNTHFFSKNDEISSAVTPHRVPGGGGRSSVTRPAVMPERNLLYYAFVVYNLAETPSLRKEVNHFGSDDRCCHPAYPVLRRRVTSVGVSTASLTLQPDRKRLPSVMGLMPNRAGRN